MLSPEDKQSIINDFPNVKLSYENIAHNKVYFDNFDIFLAVPLGRKCFAWFTSYGDDSKNVCFILEINQNSYSIDNVRIMSCCFNSRLSYGTIFYGTLFKQYNNNFFTIEDIFYYKGSNISQYIWSEKFKILNNILDEELKQVIYNDSFVAFGLPLFTTNITDMKMNLSKIRYKIATIQMRQLDRKNVSIYLTFNDFMNLSDRNQNRPQPRQQFNKQYDNKYNQIENVNRVQAKLPGVQAKLPCVQAKLPTNFQMNKQNNINQTNKTKSEIIFKVTPDIQNDIYHLYCKDDKGAEIYFEKAYIPDYTTSVMMNKLFRNIKENDNLDALEESDDEEEFENEKEDRFVYLDKTYNMVCKFNYKFKKWYPIKITEDGISNINQIRK